MKEIQETKQKNRGGKMERNEGCVIFKCRRHVPTVSVAVLIEKKPLILDVCSSFFFLDSYSFGLNGKTMTTAGVEPAIS